MKSNSDSAQWLATYVTAMNTQNSDLFLTSFAPEAIVEDEGHRHQGTDAIRQWIEGAFAAYQPKLEVTDVQATDTGLLVTGSVSGAFDGSPALLNHHFTTDAGRIEGLKIVPV